MVKVKVNVTAKEIKKGTKGCLNSCPVALALLKTFDGDICVNVDNDELFISDNNDFSKFVKFGNPKIVSSFIENFDENYAVKPFSFVIKLSNKLSKIFKIKKQYLVKE